MCAHEYRQTSAHMHASVYKYMCQCVTVITHFFEVQAKAREQTHMHAYI